MISNYSLTLSCYVIQMLNILRSLKEFGRLISAIEDEKERMLDQAQQFIIPLENFRKVSYQ